MGSDDVVGQARLSGPPLDHVQSVDEVQTTFGQLPLDVETAE